MRYNVLVTVPEDGRIIPSVITPRAPKPGKIVPALAPGDVRPYRFAATDAVGMNAVEMVKYGMAADTFTGWIGITDPTERRANLAALVLAGTATVKTETVSTFQPPTEDDLSAVCDIVGGWVGLNALNEFGIMVVPSDAADKAAKTAKTAKTESDKRAAVAADFAARMAARAATRAIENAAALAAAKAITDAAITAGTIAGTLAGSPETPDKAPRAK